MPEQSPNAAPSAYTSGQQWPQPTHVSPHTSQHTSSCPTPISSEHSPRAGVPLPPSPVTRAPGPRPAFPPPGPPVAVRPLRVVVADDNPVVRAGLTALLTGRDDIRVVAEAADGRQAYDVTVREQPDMVLLDVRMPGVDGIAALPYLVPICPVMMLTYSQEREIVQEALRLGAGGYLVHGEFTADQLVDAVRDIKQGRPHFTATAAGALLQHVRTGAAAGVPLPDGLGQAQPPHDGDADAHRRDGANDHRHHQGAGTQAEFGMTTPSRSRENPSLTQRDVEQSRTVSPMGPDFGLSTREVEVMELIASGMTNQQIAATCFISEKTVKNHINRIFGKLHSSSRSEAVAVWLGRAPRAVDGPQGRYGSQGRHGAQGSDGGDR